MKKYFYYPLAVLALVSCSNDEFFGKSPKPVQKDSATIAFSPTKGLITRADHTGSDAATLLGKNFVVEGVKGHGSFGSYDATNEVFDHYNVNWIASSANTTESNTADWEYVDQPLEIKGTSSKLSSATVQAIKFWDYGTSQYDFVAVSLGKGTGATPTYAKLSKINYQNIGSNASAVYDLTGTADELASAYIADLVTVYNQGGVSEYETTVTPKFRSLGTKVRVGFYELVPGYSVNNVKFYSDAWDGATATSTSGATDATLFAATAVFPSATSKGTMSVYYPTVGFSKRPGGSEADPDYNQAHIKFAAGSESGDALVKTKTFGALDYKTAPQKGEASSAKYMGRSSSEATYAGNSTDNYYQTALPLGTSDNIQIRVEYDLIPIDGGKEVIHVRDARAVIPAQYCDWKPNYAYTYIFKISDNTNGWTGVDGSGNVVEGLTPITFDAIVVDTEDGIQETVTSISTPSITTYQEGVNASTISEYKPGDIYASVMNGLTAVNLSALSAPAGVAVYEATTDGTNDINEAIVQNMLNGSKSGTGITLTSIGYSVVSTVPAVDGNTLAVSAVKFTAQGGKTYVFMYTDGSKNYVKVIRVASEGVAGIAYNWQAAVNSYTYTASVTATGGNEITFTYAAGSVSATKREILDDLARYLGAVYYAGGASTINWNSTDYTWNPTASGNLKGSNWYGGSSTLVSALNTWYASNPTATQIVLKIDGTDTTLKFVQL